jgi:hypothetical protein
MQNCIAAIVRTIQQPLTSDLHLVIYILWNQLGV